MANNRTNMVSLMDFGKWLGGQVSDIIEMGDGYTEITEDWAPNTSGTTYVNQEAASNTLNNYDLSMNPSREHMSDEAQQYIDQAFRKFPTGKNAETDYYRFYKTDKVVEKENSYLAIKVPVIAGPSSTGGSGGATLTSSLQINGNGDVVEGVMTLNEEGKWEFTPGTEGVTTISGKKLIAVPTQSAGQSTGNNESTGKSTSKTSGSSLSE